MTRPLSQLVRAHVQPSESQRRLIALHGYNQFQEDIRDAAIAVLPDGDVTTAQAAKGVFVARSITGYSWFVGPLTAPSPVHFGDALVDLERFLWDEIDRQSSPAALPFLMGREQGAIMSIAMAGATPDLLSGVIAMDATFPDVPGWSPPLAPLNDLPVLLVAPKTDLVSTLEAWGAEVSVVETSEAGSIREWLLNQPVRHLQES